MFSRIHQILVHKMSLSKFRNTEIVPTSFLDHKGIKLKMNSTKKRKNSTNTGSLNNMLLNNQWIRDQIKTRSSNIWGQIKTTPQPQTCGMQ